MALSNSSCEGHAWPRLTFYRPRLTAFDTHDNGRPPSGRLFDFLIDTAARMQARRPQGMGGGAEERGLIPILP
jgi:hypothetical protein